MRRGLTGRMVIASGLLAIIVGGAFAAVLLTVTTLRGTTDLRRETREALIGADTLEKQIIDLETGVRGFVITRDDSFLQPSEDARASLPASARALERLSAGEPVQNARVQRIVRAMNVYVERYALPLVDAVRRNDPSVRSVARTITAKQRVDALREGLNSFREAERARLNTRDADVDTAARRATAAAAVGIAASIFLIIAFSGYLTRVIVRPLRRAALMANRLAGGDLSARMRENDVAEIGALERSFNVMAGSLETNRDKLASLLAEQAALRRVATLVAQAAAPEEVFAVTAAEIGGLLGTHATALARYEPDATATVLALETDVELGIRVGARLTLEGESAMGAVLRTGRAARQDSFEQVTGTIADLVHRGRLDSSVGAPIIVEGRLWGVVIVSSRGVLPADTEQRLGDFGELLATTIANAESRAALARVSDQQAALRRVATLVAQAAAPAEVFTAVADELGRLLGADTAVIARVDDDAMTTVVACWGAGASEMPVQSRWRLAPPMVMAAVVETGHSARVDDDAQGSRAFGDAVPGLHVASAVATPVLVAGRLWGATIVATGREPLAADTEQRMADFTELVATAIANADGRTQLVASRARLLTAGDDARRRVVRDLHDGAQQRLVQTIVTLKLARSATQDDGAPSAALVAEALDQAERANLELRELAHGILPAVLTRGGLRAGVNALVSRVPVPVAVAVDVDGERLPTEIEASAYFIVAEALTNVAKHSRARSAHVTAWVQDNALHVDVRDDGVGGARPDGTGLLGLNDRVAALGGHLRVESAPGAGTLVAATLPL
jgi:signal transduction histidine kinase/CHASE3 domain sensor protein